MQSDWSPADPQVDYSVGSVCLTKTLGRLVMTVFACQVRGGVEGDPQPRADGFTRPADQHQQQSGTGHGPRGDTATGGQGGLRVVCTLQALASVSLFLTDSPTY